MGDSYGASQNTSHNKHCGSHPLPITHLHVETQSHQIKVKQCQCQLLTNSPTLWCALPSEVVPSIMSLVLCFIVCQCCIPGVLVWFSSGGWPIIGICYASIMLLSLFFTSGSYMCCCQLSLWWSQSLWGTLPHHHALFIVVGFYTVTFDFCHHAEAFHLRVLG